MAKKRGFVRYTKKGKLVPGSLVVTTNGGYPDKSSLWKEVDYDLCCDSVCPECPECPECPQCFQANTTYTVTEEQLADATGNTGITVNILGEEIETVNNVCYIVYRACESSGSSTISSATNFGLCGTATTVLYFKNDQPIFIPGITTNLCTS
jgi:hypothetical protein